MDLVETFNQIILTIFHRKNIYNIAFPTYENNGADGEILFLKPHIYSTSARGKRDAILNCRTCLSQYINVFTSRG